MLSHPAYYRYWGKAQPKPSVSTNPYHLLVYHSLDVAATAYQLLHDDAPIMDDLSAYLGIAKLELRRLLCFLIEVDKKAYAYSKRHNALGWCFYQNALFNNVFCHQDLLDEIEFGLDIFFNCVLGHHGKPINTYDDPVDFDDLLAVGVDYEKEITPNNLQAANEWIADLQALFNVDMPICRLTCWLITIGKRV